MKKKSQLHQVIQNDDNIKQLEEQCVELMKSGNVQAVTEFVHNNLPGELNNLDKIIEKTKQWGLNKKNLDIDEENEQAIMREIEEGALNRPSSSQGRQRVPQFDDSQMGLGLARINYRSLIIKKAQSVKIIKTKPDEKSLKALEEKIKKEAEEEDTYTYKPEKRNLKPTIL